MPAELILLFRELDYPSGSTACCVFLASWPGPCFGEQSKPSLGLVTPVAFLGTSSKVSDAAQLFFVSVWQLVLEKKIHFLCVHTAVKEYSSFHPPSPLHAPKMACSLAKAHMAFLCFKCSSYYHDLKVYRVKETFMEQLRPVRT